MRIWRGIWLVPVVLAMGCQAHRDGGESAQALTPAARAAVEESVRQFMGSVAHDITTEGPTAWSREFEEGPDFFMAVNGKLAFSSGDAAAQGIRGLPLLIKSIELRWGDDLRVDPLTPDLAVVGTPYQEVQVDPKDHEARSSGYFTGVVERQNGKWKFRDAHWSEAAPEKEAAK
jgi:hypothetical protein